MEFTAVTPQQFVDQYSGYVGLAILGYLAWQYRGGVGSVAAVVKGQTLLPLSSPVQDPPERTTTTQSLASVAP